MILRRIKKIVTNNRPATNKELNEIKSELKDVSKNYYELGEQVTSLLETLAEHTSMNRNDINNLARQLQSDSKSNSKNKKSKDRSGVMFG